MATGVIGHVSSSFGADGVAAAMRLGRDGSVITRDFIWQLALEGKIFVAGHGLEESAQTGRTSLDETTPDIHLKSPVGGNVLIVPLYFEALVTSEGGAAPDWHVNVITVDKAITTAGTAQTPQSLGKVGVTSAAVVSHVPTLAAYTSLENKLLASSRNALDNLISVESATGANTDKDDYMNNRTKIVWAPRVPVVLVDGQAWCFYSATGTTGQSFVYTLYYAELAASAYR